MTTAADFVAYAERRDQRARERLVRTYLPLTVSIARRYQRDRRVPPDDLRQVAAIGLLKAIDRFDPDRGIELAERMHCTVEEVVEASEAAQARAIESFDCTVDDNQESTFALAERIGTEERGYAAAEAAAMAQDLLSVLSERERRAIHLRFHHDLTQAEIAHHIGCSQMHVSRILRQALARLAEEAGSDGDRSLVRSLD